MIREAPRRSWIAWLLLLMLGVSLFFNLGQFGALLLTLSGDVSAPNAPIEVHHSGAQNADAKIALVEVSGTIMPPFTKRILDTLDHIENDRDVKGVILVVDSPGDSWLTAIRSTTGSRSCGSSGATCRSSSQ